MYLIIMNTKNTESKFYTKYNFLEFFFFRLKAKEGGTLKKEENVIY